MSSFILDELREHINELADGKGLFVLDISSRGGRGVFIEVILDKDGGVSLDDCTDFNREIISWIDNNNILPGRYTIDVCSPGLDRALKTYTDFEWATGKMIKISTNEPVGEKKTFKGKLVQFDDKTGVTLEVEGGEPVQIAADNISKAKLWSEI